MLLLVDYYYKTTYQKMKVPILITIATCK